MEGLQRRPFDFTEVALGYLAQGWSVIPIQNGGNGHKRPACRWKKYQTRCPTSKEIARLFSQPDLTGLGVVLGLVSGGLYARDFDIEAAYHRWAEQYPTLAKTLPTVKTKRGYHVYAYHEGLVETQHLDDGELRGERAYNLLPPSLHPSGISYEWLRSFEGANGNLHLSPTEAGLDRSWEGTNGQGELLPDTEVQRYRGTEGTEGTDVVKEREGGETTLPGRIQTLSDLLQVAQPDAVHQNHAKLFRLARGVKALEAQEGRPWTDKNLHNQVFLPWYTANRHLRPRQSREDYWFEFLRAYEDVKYPLGENILDRAWEAAEGRDSFPKVAEQFDHPELRQLVLWCREIQRQVGDQPFYLSCRSVQARFNLSNPTQASNRLYGLVRAGILAEVEKGSAKTRRATRFRYLPPLDDAASEGSSEDSPPT